MTPEKERAIDAALLDFGSGVASETRRPRSLRQRGMFKAEEWKFFVLQSSLIVFHDVLPEAFLRGWNLFVQIVELCTRPHLPEADVNNLEHLCRKFYSFYEGTFYDGVPEQIRVCKMTIHYVLRLADSVRNCGPLLNVSQFPMERFIGEAVHALNATYLAAESVLQHWKFQASCISYQLRTGIASGLSHGVHNATRYPRPELHVTSSLPEFDEVLLCHPSKASTIPFLNATLDVNVYRLMEDLYINRFETDRDTARQLLMRHPNVTLWSRMAFCSQFSDESRVVYIGCSAQHFGQERRRNYYVAGEYEDGRLQSGTLAVYYGQVVQFVEHRVVFQGNAMKFLLALVAWAAAGLKKGRQGQVYAERGRDDPRLFRNTVVEGVDVIQRHIAVVEKIVDAGRRQKKRTYFADREFMGGSF